MSNEVSKFFGAAEYQDSPLRALTKFLSEEEKNEQAGNYQQLRFVGYVLDIGFDQATIITSDPFKQAVGGVPRGSFLIMAPDTLEDLPPHFTLLRVMDTAPTPLSKEVQQTYFELHKKSMPELDIWTRGELQWGALKTQVLGMFFPDPEDANNISFSGDVNNVLSAHRYKVFSPNSELTDLIVNGTVKTTNRFGIGRLRLTECELPLPGQTQQNQPVSVSTDDFRGYRTAMFGKTRLGKSNVVKIIAQSILETTKESRNVGQLIFDINGEYANDNPQDGNKSLRSAYPDRCVVYALTKREKTPSYPLKLNFYEQPAQCMGILSNLLEQSNLNAQYVKSFASVELMNIEDIQSLERGQRNRAVRKIQMYWAILSKAGFQADEQRLKNLGLTAASPYGPSHFDPHFKQGLRDAAGLKSSGPTNLYELQKELETIAEFRKQDPENKNLKSASSGGPLFDSDDGALLEFLNPRTGGGPRTLQPFRKYHDKSAGDFVKDILDALADGQTVILDLGNATEEIREYFSDMLSKEVFAYQERRFTEDNLGTHFIQLYFEEAHNLFPKDDKDFKGVYARFAKEGAKFHIGIVYSTQSPSTINQELLAQTENFFVGHISSKQEVDSLGRVQIQFEGLQDDIMKTRTPGYMRIMTFSNRFVVPTQINKFEAVASDN